MAVADQPPECKEAAKAQRKAESKLPPKVKAKPHVTAGGSFQSTGGASTSMSASGISRSRIKKGPDKYKGFEGGIGSSSETSVSCGGKPHEYREEAGSPPYCDAEAKIIEGIFKRAGGSPSGTLHMKVGGKPVCCDCQKLISCASESITIVICPKAERVQPCP
jgi:hypothetical protein